MRRIRETLRLVYEQGMSRSRTAAALGIGKTTLLELLERLERSRLTPSEALLFSDVDLETHLYPPAPTPPERDRIEPDVAHLVAELARPGVTRKLLWEEYRKIHPSGLGYTAFCDRIQNHRGEADLVMRQEHKPTRWRGVSIDMIDQTPAKYLYPLWNRLASGSYQPPAVRESSGFVGSSVFRPMEPPTAACAVCANNSRTCSITGRKAIRYEVCLEEPCEGRLSRTVL